VSTQPPESANHSLLTHKHTHTHTQLESVNTSLLDYHHQRRCWTSPQGITHLLLPAQAHSCGQNRPRQADDPGITAQRGAIEGTRERPQWAVLRLSLQGSCLAARVQEAEAVSCLYKCFLRCMLPSRRLLQLLLQWCRKVPYDRSCCCCGVRGCCILHLAACAEPGHSLARMG
jgi:hypothetical protein